MGDLYKQAGGWKGIREDYLIPLAEYQKSLGMNTSFTRLADAYTKIKDIQEKRKKNGEANNSAASLPVAKSSATAANPAVAASSAGTNSFSPQYYPSADKPYVSYDFRRNLPKLFVSYYRQPLDGSQNYDVNDYNYYLNMLNEDNNPNYSQPSWWERPQFLAEKEKFKFNLPDYLPGDGGRFRRR